MNIVSILLCFTTAYRDGLWDLHLYAFSLMLPVFFRYDHINYARWGSVYLAEMSDLPSEVLQEFQDGNFVVKQTDRKSNQVSADQSTEWLNATGKKRGGLVGITRIETSLSRWALSYNMRTIIAAHTKTMFGLTEDGGNDHYTHNEAFKSRMVKDDSDESRIVEFFKQHCIFQGNGEALQNVVTKDIATPLIQESLLNAERLGKEQMMKFVDQRLCKPLEKRGSHKYEVTTAEK